MEEREKEIRQTESSMSLKAWLTGVICWDCDDLTDKELEEYFEEAA